jgi:hypothetical protein
MEALIKRSCRRADKVIFVDEHGAAYTVSRWRTSAPVHQHVIAGFTIYWSRR